MPDGRAIARHVHAMRPGILPTVLQLGVRQISAHKLERRVLEKDALRVVTDGHDPMAVIRVVLIRAATAPSAAASLPTPRLDHHHHGMTPPQLATNVLRGHRLILADGQSELLRESHDLIRMRSDAMVHAQLVHELPFFVRADAVELADGLQARRAARVVLLLRRVGERYANSAVGNSATGCPHAARSSSSSPNTDSHCAQTNWTSASLDSA